MLDAIPCDVKAENISNCNKAGYMSVVGSKREILKLMGNSAPYIEGLCSYRQVRWQASSQ